MTAQLGTRAELGPQQGGHNGQAGAPLQEGTWLLTPEAYQLAQNRIQENLSS